MEESIDWFTRLWPYLTALAALTVATLVSLHVLLHKHEPRSAIGWVGLIWLVPFLGSFLYLMLGINRVQASANRLRGRHGLAISRQFCTPATIAELTLLLGDEDEHLLTLADFIERLPAARKVALPLVSGNRIEALSGGDEAYPRMLAAINEAKHSITLSSYIFNRDRIGMPFVEALTNAHERGVAVRVIVDDAGALGSFPSIVRRLKKRGVPTTHFLPTFLAFQRLSLNLRNHRKLLVADGRLAFTGGINIDERSMFSLGTKFQARDLHFEVEGPVIAQLQAVFAADWFTCMGEELSGELWFPELAKAGNCIARAIADGPDQEEDTLRWTLLGALATAKRSVRIVSPYFLPDPPLAAALGVAAMRGVQVEVYFPGQSDLPPVAWAAFDQLMPVLERGVHVYRMPAPFDHTKLMTVDGVWSMIGSANWDPRSLRLNFELNTEIFDRELASQLEAMCDERKAVSTLVTPHDLESRSLPIKIRDGLARLLSMYY